MKHSILTKFQRSMALIIALLLIAGLTACKKDDDSAKESTPPAETTTAPTAPSTTEATTEAPTEATTEAPTEAATEAPTTEAPQESVKGTVTANTLKIRSGAGTNYGSVGTYTKGNEIEILEISGDWGRTSKGWVSLDYVKLEGSTTEEKPTTSDEVVSDGKTTALGHGVVNLGSLNVRTGPGTNYEKVDTVSLGERYAYYQKSGNWVRINDGWISLSYFYVEGNTGDGACTGTLTSDLNIRSGPGTGYDRVGSYAKGETVKILTKINSWGYTSKGWISMNYVTVDGTTSSSTTGKGTVTADTLNIRKSASTDAEKVGTYNKGDVVEILEVSGDWGRTSKGWVSLDYVKMGSSTTSSTKGTITASALYIRKDASKESETVGSYSKGDTVEILETKDGWGRTNKGWIYLDYVKMDS